MNGKAYIQKLKARKIAFYLGNGLILSISLCLLIGSLLHYACGTGLWGYASIFVLSLIVYLWFYPFWKIDDKHIARYLNQHFPQLEDSAELWLKAPTELGTLAHLQVAKISEQLPLPQVFKGFIRKSLMALGCLGLGIAMYSYIAQLPLRQSHLISAEDTATHSPIKENLPPQIAAYTISITPPAYTAQPVRNQRQFYIKAETGAKITWNIRTNKRIKSFFIRFNNENRFKLSPSATDSTTWTYTSQIEKQGFYQLELDEVKSDLYPIDVIPDLPVVIKLLQPKPQTTIDIGEPAQINLKALLTDDYGIAEAFISATMASGKGESVSFTERKINFGTSFKGQKTQLLAKVIDLKSLGMKPGDELYYFIQAKDNKGQQSRSDVYTASIIDTAELMSMAGMTSGVNLVPEYFRSQRQIILDTEKLLAEKNSISTAEFKKRSNTLGIDQKLLRLRYGQFLGEENETSIGGDHDDHDHDDHDHEPEKFGDVQALMDKYAHKHDIAEDATFFEPETKAQLKAVLNEMWKSELQLRTYQPQTALPFEYKALRLLKDLQQKSRAYVAKTTIKTAALKLEKRLTGELDKIVEPAQKLQYEIKDNTREELRVLLALLAAHEHQKSFSDNEKALLRTGERQIINAAANHPETYLPALKSVRRLQAQTIPAVKDLDMISNALYKIIGAGIDAPRASNVPSDKKLSNSYFNHLKNN